MKFKLGIYDGKVGLLVINNDKIVGFIPKGNVGDCIRV